MSTNSPHRTQYGTQDVISTRSAKSNPGSPDLDSNLDALELKFVTTTGPPAERSKESRLVVRSHAMQAFLREKKSNGKGATKEPDVIVKSLDESIGRFKLTSWSRKSRKKSSFKIRNEKSTVIEGSSNGVKSLRNRKDMTAIPTLTKFLDQFDPFGILPITLTGRTKILLYHYSTGFTMNSAAVNPEGSWLSFALTDAALLHATLSLVAYHYDITHGRDESLDSLYQKGEAIKRMNRRLGDSHEQFSDTTIATVALFTNIETMSGTRPISDVHMAALEKMVAFRGGLQSFGYNKVLQRVLTWADIIYSSTWDCPPRFPVPQSYKSNDSPQSTLSRFSTLSLPSYNSSTWCRSNHRLPSILEMLRRLSRAITTPNLEVADRVAISNQIYQLEHALLSPPDSDSDFAAAMELYDDDGDFYGDLGLPQVDLSQPFRIAALLYVHLVLRELPSTAKMHYKLASNLKVVLEEQAMALVHTTSRQTLELLSWIFFMGGAVASDLGERRYFVTLLLSVMGGLGLEGKEQFRGVLEGVVWRRGVCEGYFGDLWLEMRLI